MLFNYLNICEQLLEIYIDMNRRLFLQIKVARNFDHWIAALETVAKEYRQECAHFDKVRGALEHEQLKEDI